MKHSKCEDISTILKENTTLKIVKRAIKLEIDFIPLRRGLRYHDFESLILAQD